MLYQFAAYRKLGKYARVELVHIVRRRSRDMEILIIGAVLWVCWQVFWFGIGVIVDNRKRIPLILASFFAYVILGGFFAQNRILDPNLAVIVPIPIVFIWNWLIAKASERVYGDVAIAQTAVVGIGVLIIVGLVQLSHDNTLSILMPIYIIGSSLVAVFWKDFWLLWR